MAFSGIPADALAFYDELDRDNTKPFWEANKARYVEMVKGPVTALTEELNGFGDFHMFRPHNDLRFSKNRPPYKTHQGAYTESEGGAGFYFQVSADGLMAGTGYYSMAKDQLARFRSAIDDDETAEPLAEIVAGLAKKYSVSAISELKTAPRGYPKDHKRIELLRRKGLLISYDFGAPKWLHTKAAVSRITAMWQAGDEMNQWLDQHVGPTEIERDGFF